MKVKLTKRELYASIPLVVIVVSLTVYLLVHFASLPPAEPLPLEEVTVIEEAIIAPSATKGVTIGTSVLGKPIEAYTYGTGDAHILFVGGIHGGYEWNSVLLSYELMDYLETHSALIPADVRITVIPSANPDGIVAVLGTAERFTLEATRTLPDNPAGKGRFNANNVDLNRNFDCKWQPESSWRGTSVSAGDSPFSEPEAQAIRDFVLEKNPVAAIFFHSKSDAVYASECEEGILPGTRTLMNTYATASGYKAVDVFDAYEITGDVEGWLASIGIPAVTVELATHETVEWTKNLPAIRAVINLYSEEQSLLP